ncbi:MAG: outer membrane beta-barrel protein [Gemmatimonadota bacterium]|nr:outer membrane beta-barrel protein [Gemmatimonadota bacterium]
MRTTFRLTAALAFAAGLLLADAPKALAQATPYELNLHIGGFRYDIEDSDTDVMLGARFLLQYPSGWGWGGNFDWVPVDRIATTGDDIDFDLYLYSFEVDYTVQTGDQVRPFVGAGIGAATFRVGDLPPGPGDDEESETNVLIPLAVGVKFFDDPRQPTWAIRGEIRDNVVFVDEDDLQAAIAGDDGAQNNIEFSGGISFFF